MEQIETSLFRAEYKSIFKQLNVDWIQNHFVVEKKDLEQLNNPEKIIEEGGQIIFTLLNNEVTGCCAVVKVDNEIYEIAKMAVNPSQRGHGLGSLLMDACEEWAVNKGAKKMIILSNTVLEPAINLYKKHGYETIKLGPNPEYDRCNIYMEKIID